MVCPLIELIEVDEPWLGPPTIVKLLKLEDEILDGFSFSETVYSKVCPTPTCEGALALQVVCDWAWLKNKSDINIKKLILKIFPVVLIIPLILQNKQRF